MAYSKRASGQLQGRAAPTDLGDGAPPVSRESCTKMPVAAARRERVQSSGVQEERGSPQILLSPRFLLVKFFVMCARPHIKCLSYWERTYF